MPVISAYDSALAYAVADEPGNLELFEGSSLVVQVSGDADAGVGNFSYYLRRL